MAKDVRLYLDEAAGRGAPCDLATVTAQVWRRFAEAEPGADFTRIHPFVRGAPGGDGPATAGRG